MRKTLLLGLAALLAAATLAGTATATHAARRVVISTRKLPKLGLVLVTGSGRTLYMFEPDKRRRVTCVSTCASLWPPLKLAKGAEPLARGNAKASLLGSDRDPEGGRVVTYHGWPLYTYVGDGGPGAANGQALNSAGGRWYVLSPSGKVIRTKR